MSQLDQNVFSARRQWLKDLIGDQGIAIIAASPERLRNKDVEYPYRADSDFRYLTGFLEPQAIAVIAPKREQGEYILFCRQRNPEMETWTGRRAGIQGAQQDFQADQAFAYSEFEAKLAELLAGRQTVYLPFSSQPELYQRFQALFTNLPRQSRQGIDYPIQCRALDDLIHERRLIKTQAELVCMRQAAQISADAHKAAMQLSKPGLYEYQLAGRIQYEFEWYGTTWAYPTIVGGGKNSCILHYIENSDPLREGDLVLIDAGAEYQGYAGDITRTFPVNGRFSAAQRQVYDIVLAANLAGIEAAQAGAPANAPHEAALRALVTGLIELKLLSGTIEQNLETKAYRRFYMHGTSHWLGLDVHDVGAYKQKGEWRTLKPGMVLTIEPGLYIPADEDIPSQYRNIGIRIEDDIVVSQERPEVMTCQVPKQPEAIEALMRQG